MGINSTIEEIAKAYEDIPFIMALPKQSENKPLFEITNDLSAELDRIYEHDMWAAFYTICFIDGTRVSDIEWLNMIHAEDADDFDANISNALANPDKDVEAYFLVFEYSNDQLTINTYGMSNTDS